MPKILDRLSHAADRFREPPVHAAIAGRLSGALQERCIVKPGPLGIMAAVPAAALIPTGLRVVESAVPGHAPVLAGTAGAVANAEARVAKLAGEGVTAKLVDYRDDRRVAVFVLTGAEA